MMRVAALALCLLVLLLPAQAQEQGYAIGARPLELSTDHPLGSKVGRIRLLGMLELPPVNIAGVRLVELSDLAWDEDEKVLYAVSDRGALFWLRPIFRNGMLADLHVLRAFPLLDSAGQRLKGRQADAEGMDILYGDNARLGDTELVISFERDPRIVFYRPNATFIGEQSLPPALVDIRAYDSQNHALESLALMSRLGIVTAPEYPLKAERRDINRIYSMDGRSWTYPIYPDSGIVAMKWLEGEKLLVLERSIHLLTGHVIARLRIADLSHGDRIQPENVVELDNHAGMTVDNFEGLARHRGNRFFMVSDDNGNPFQRTLLLYFELLPR